MKTSFVLSLVVLLCSIGQSVQAVEPDGRLFRSDRAWLERFDSILLSSRISSEFSWENNDAEADLFEIENTVRWGVPLGEDLAFGFQALQPLKWADGSDEEAEGLGDLELRAGVMNRVSQQMRFGFALNAVFDTANNPQLGDGAFVLRPIAALRWDFHEKFTFGINVEYNFTPQEEGSDDVSNLEIKFPLIFRLSEKWSTFVSYNHRWNLLEETDRQRIEFTTSCAFGKDKEYEWSIGGEVPLSSEDFECKWKTGVTWFF